MVETENVSLNSEQHVTIFFFFKATNVQFEPCNESASLMMRF